MYTRSVKVTKVGSTWGKHFSSVKRAREAYGVAASTSSYALQTGKPIKGYVWTYMDGLGANKFKKRVALQPDPRPYEAVLKDYYEGLSERTLALPRAPLSYSPPEDTGLSFKERANILATFCGLGVMAVGAIYSAFTLFGTLFHLFVK